MIEDDAAPSPPDAELTRRDAAYIATLDGVVAVHANESHWWNNASFALPLLGCIVLVAVGLVGGITEALGFGLFLGVVTVLMLPVVLAIMMSVSPLINAVVDWAELL